MDLSDEDLDSLVAKSFANVTTYDGLLRALSEVLYAPGMPKPKVRELIGDSLKSLVVSNPSALTFNAAELVLLLERMLHFASINTWLLQQFCEECYQSRTTCQACTNGTKVYKQGPQISISNLTMTGKPQRVFNGDTATPRTVEFTFETQDPIARDTLFESEFPEMDFDTKLWLTLSWVALRQQYDIDKDTIGKPQDRRTLIENLKKSGEVHQLYILLFTQSRCLNCGEVRGDGKKYYCSKECDDDFGQFFKDWTRKHRYKGDYKERALERLRTVLQKKRLKAQG